MELSTTPVTISCAATQPLPSILWIPKVHYRIHKSPSLVPISSQTIRSTLTHSVSSWPISILSTHLCIGLPRGLFPSGFPINNILLHAPVAKQQNRPRQVCFHGDCLGNKATIGQDVVSCWLAWGNRHLTSERAPHRDKKEIFWKKLWDRKCLIISPEWARHQDRQS
jgi:hypothetical protein